MARAFYNECNRQNISCTKVCSENIPDFKSSGEHIMVHFGSGNNLQMMIDESIKTGIPIIQGSTNKKSQEVMNASKGVRIINAPNLSIPIVKLVANIEPVFKELLKFMDLSVTESHQAGKADISGTARFVLERFGLSKIKYPKLETLLFKEIL